MIDQTEAGRLSADPDILGDCLVRHQVQFLMDHGDADVGRVPGRVEVDASSPTRISPESG
jgi:hypothetical protein